ncbi:MAG: translocation/assembly module TamB domain-containing protein [Candidatus Aminicenantes bacterium]|nr:translocation/assembly module TamB domain-containing protein [Candidatus Aminicenantes bacterium]
MKFGRRLKSLVTIFVILAILFGGGTFLKNMFLRQLRAKIQSNFDFNRFHFTIFPPGLIIEELRTKSLHPFFSAKSVKLKFSYKSLLTQNRPFNILIDHPVLIIYPNAQPSKKEGKIELSTVIPISLGKALIRKGEIYYWGEELRIQSKGINAIFTQRKNRLALEADIKENLFSLNSDMLPVRGQASLFIEGDEREIHIKKFRFVGPERFLKAQGTVWDISDPVFKINSSFKVESGLIARFLRLPFEWGGKISGKGVFSKTREGIGIVSSFSSNALILNHVAMGKCNGRVNYKKKKGGNVELSFQKRGLLREYVNIQFAGDYLEGNVRQFYLDPIIKPTGFPWPVASPAWGRFAFSQGRMTADVEFRDDMVISHPDRFPFRGHVKVDWDGADSLSFYSQNLISTFAKVELQSKLVISKSMDTLIRGEVLDLKEARRFTSLILHKDFDIPEIRGSGPAEVRIFGDVNFPQVYAKFSLSPAGFSGFNAQSVVGEAELIKEDFLGRFTVVDPLLEGKISVVANKKESKTDIRLKKGYIENILPSLEINFPLKGITSGTFSFKQIGVETQLYGEFSSPTMIFSGQVLSNVKGKLDLKGNSFSFPELQFDLYKGHVKGLASLNLLTEKFNVDINCDDIDLSSLFSEGNGNVSFMLKGGGFFGQDVALGDFEIKDLVISPFQKTEAKGKLKVGFSQEDVHLEIDGNFFPGKNNFFVSLDVPYDDAPLSGEIKGLFTNFDILIPWKGGEGVINYLAQIKGPKTYPEVKGAIDFNGTTFPLAKFAHALRDYSGLIFIENGEFSLRSLQGSLGGGKIQGAGRMKIGKTGVEEINIVVDGKNMLVSPLERTRSLADGTLTLIKDQNRFVLEGELIVNKLSWRRELTEKFAFYSTPYYISQREPTFFDDLILNIRLKCNENAWMENSLGKIHARFNLNIMGSINSPILLGDIEALGGEVYFQDRKFKILRGRVGFFNPLTIEPYLNFSGETYVKDYRVTFSLDGLLDKLNPEFSSSPPLPPEDVLALLALGEAFKRTYSYDRSTQLSTASLLSFQLSEEAKKRAEKLFIIDRFRIDPFIMGSSAEMTARLTVGKKISRNFTLLYSTNLTTQREEIARIEWELMDDFSIVGTRDEKGRISIDVKIHKRF